MSKMLTMEGLTHFKEKMDESIDKKVSDALTAIPETESITNEEIDALFTAE